MGSILGSPVLRNYHIAFIYRVLGFQFPKPFKRPKTSQSASEDRLLGRSGGKPTVCLEYIAEVHKPDGWRSVLNITLVVVFHGDDRDLGKTNVVVSLDRGTAI